MTSQFFFLLPRGEKIRILNNIFKLALFFPGFVSDNEPFFLMDIFPVNMENNF